MAGGTNIPSIEAVCDGVRSRQSSAVELVERSLARIASLEPKLNCLHETLKEHALDRAARIDAAIARGEHVGSLAGVPIVVKDNIATSYGTTTCGSRILENFRSPYDATAIERLEREGAIVVGKANCDEFAMGSSTENSAWGPTRNPWDTSRVPGGSSGGSAAAVAAGYAPAALGSDTGGSIRQPAAHCGVVGVKPSYGRVSRYGLVAFGSSLDQIGPFAHSVRDAALVLQAIAGFDPRDSTTAEIDVPDYLAEIDRPVEGLRIGLPRRFTSPDNDPAVNKAVLDAADEYARLGATIVEDIDLPLTDHGISTYYVIAPAEASSNLARFDGIRYGHRAELAPDEDLFDLYARSRAEGFGPEVQRRIMLGTYVLSSGYYDAYYKRALQVRRLIKQEFDAAFAKCHAILGPTAPTPAFPLGGKADPLSMYLCDVYTVNANIAGICALSLPGGFAEVEDQLLPIGIQLQCRAFDEPTLFRVARMFEAAHLQDRLACPVA
ncbi:MAG: Asp-tRNA(Asn)/Glu-tRNA(Gln) amidotransferase subunit GatA [Phycisphaerales bacterium]|nr:Asp-tRNA(Asn)/Glu-tRNA(Gln) amidotransferase subunit GatA [Phycisphaerales bacterium]